jgi:hypothetical protein
VRTLFWPLFAWYTWFSLPLWCWTRQVCALLWPVFTWSAWAQPASVVAVTSGEGATRDCVRLAVEGSVSHCGYVQES